MQTIHRCQVCQSFLKEVSDSAKLIDGKLVVDIHPCLKCIQVDASKEAMNILRRAADTLESANG